MTVLLTEEVKNGVTSLISYLNWLMVEKRYLAREGFLHSEINFLRKRFSCGSVYF